MHARHPGWAQRAQHLHHHTYTAEQVIVAAHAYGSAKLLLHMQHKGRLPGLSSQLGQRARTNSEQLLAITRTHGEWKRRPGQDPPHAGVGFDHLRRLARSGDEHRARLLGRRQRPVRVPRHLPPARRAEASDRGLGQGARRAPDRGAQLRRRAQLGRADGGHALLADDRHVDRAVLARRPAAEPAHRHSALGAHPDRRGVRRPDGSEDGRPRGRAAVRGHQPHRLGPLHRRDPDRRQQRDAAPSTPTSACSASRACTSSTEA